MKASLPLHPRRIHAFRPTGDALWIGFPSRAYKTDDGTTGYAPVVQFASNEARRRLQAEAGGRLWDMFLAGGNW